MNESFTRNFNRPVSESTYKVIWATVTGGLFFGAAAGALLSPCVANKWGRKKGLMVSNSVLLGSGVWPLNCSPMMLITAVRICRC
jgi:MFS family permease